MKRGLTLLAIIAAAIAAFFSIRGSLPFMPVFGTSMEPVLHAGNIILIQDIPPSKVKVGDIIVYSVPSAIREHYNYPPVVAHRVIKIVQQEGVGTVWRTKGDNTGEDPFTIRAQDLKGKVSAQVPYLGFPLLFFQSREGLIFVIIALILLTLYLYMDEITMGRRKVQEGIFSPVIRANQRRDRVLEQRTENLEKGMDATQHALEAFAGAIEEYATHLKSHTSAIQGLSAASHELKDSAAVQNQVLSRLAEVVERTVLATTPPEQPPSSPAVEKAPAAKQPLPKPKIEAAPAKVIEPVSQPEVTAEKTAAPKPVAKPVKKTPPGCIKSRQQNSRK